MYVLYRIPKEEASVLKVRDVFILGKLKREEEDGRKLISIGGKRFLEGTGELVEVDEGFIKEVEARSGSMSKIIEKVAEKHPAAKDADIVIIENIAGEKVYIVVKT